LSDKSVKVTVGGAVPEIGLAARLASGGARSLIWMRAVPVISPVVAQMVACPSVVFGDYPQAV
jgi:hypothetical protein